MALGITWYIILYLELRLSLSYSLSIADLCVDLEPLIRMSFPTNSLRRFFLSLLIFNPTESTFDSTVPNTKYEALI